MYANRSAGLLSIIPWVVEACLVAAVIGFMLFAISNPAVAAQMTANAVAKAAHWLVLTFQLVMEEWRKLPK